MKHSSSSSSSISSCMHSLAFRYCSILAVTHEHSSCFLVPPSQLATACPQLTSASSAVAWAASSSFWISVVLLLASLHISSLPAKSPNPMSAFWRKKRPAVQQISNPNPRRVHHKLSHHRRRGNRHISHNRHHRALHPNPGVTVQQIPGSSNNSLQEKKKQLSLLSFSPSLFSSSALLPFLFTSSQIFLCSFFLLSSLPTRSSLSQLLKKFSSCIAVYSLTTSQSFLLQDSMGLSVPLILPTQIHLTVFCIPS